MIVPMDEDAAARDAHLEVWALHAQLVQSAPSEQLLVVKREEGQSQQQDLGKALAAAVYGDGGSSAAAAAPADWPRAAPPRRWALEIQGRPANGSYAL